MMYSDQVRAAKDADIRNRFKSLITGNARYNLEYTTVGSATHTTAVTSLR